MNVEQSVLETSPLAMAVTEGPAHAVRYINPAFRDLFGKEEQELVGHPFAEAIPGSQEEGVVSLLDEAFQEVGKATVENVEHIDPARGPVYRSYAVWAIPGGENEKEGLLLQVADSTELVLAEQRLQRISEEMREVNERLVITSVRQQEMVEEAAIAEQRLRDLVHGLDVIVCEVDARTGQFTFVSQWAETFLGYSMDRWFETNYWRRVIYPGDFKKVINLSRKALQDRSDHEYEFRARSADGSVVWLRNIVHLVPDTTGEVSMLRCVIVDITRQKQAEQALEEAFERERRITEALQRSILQDIPKNIYPGLDVVAFYEPALTEALIGGDFFDAFRLPDDQVVLVIGDVTGKGLEAAAHTAEVKFALRAFAMEHSCPAEIATHLNNFLFRFHPQYDDDFKSLIVLSLMMINPITGEALVTLAGTDPPIIIRKSGAIETVALPGTILGMQPRIQYKQEKLFLDTGDLVIMVTDGITEARHGLEFFGYEGVAQTARQTVDNGTLSDSGRAILTSARNFAGGRFQDDVCLLLARRG